MSKPSWAEASPARWFTAIPTWATTGQIDAELAVAWFPENDGSVFKPSFASIHSTPPAPESPEPAIVSHTYGNGRSFYVAGAIEAEDFDINRKLVTHLIRRLVDDRLTIEVVAPRFIEFTVFEKTADHCLNVSLVSLHEAEEIPPASGSIQIQFDAARTPCAVRLLPDLTPVAWRTVADRRIEFPFSDFHLLQMFEVEYETTGCGVDSEK